MRCDTPESHHLPVGMSTFVTHVGTRNKPIRRRSSVRTATPRLTPRVRRPSQPHELNADSPDEAGFSLETAAARQQQDHGGTPNCVRERTPCGAPLDHRTGRAALSNRSNGTTMKPSAGRSADLWSVALPV